MAHIRYSTLVVTHPHAPVHAMIYTVGSSQTLDRGSAQRSLPQAGQLKVFMPADTKNSENFGVAALAPSPRST